MHWKSGMYVGRVFVGALAVALFCSISVLAQQLLGATWDLGPRRFVTDAATAAGPLTVRAMGSADLGSFSFVESVGGVSFEQVATPDASQDGQPVSLSYDPSLPDGNRLVVHIGSNTLRTYLPDWELRPIANFANSEYAAVVSLFGKGPDEKRYYYIQYHSAFKDTLLGMRLLQADIMFMSLGENWRLPRYNGELVLGLGEWPPPSNAPVKAARRISDILRGQEFRSWVLTDIDQHPTFGNNQGALSFSVQPYYYFWRLDEAKAKATLTVHDSLINEYNDLLNKYKTDVAKYNSMVESYNSTAKETRIDLEAKLDSLNIEIDNEGKKLDELKAKIDASLPPINAMTDLTSSMAAADRSIAAYNPDVYVAYQPVDEVGFG